MAEFESQTRRPEIQFAVSGVPPPATLYINKLDRLVVRSRSVSASTFYINWRILLPTGEIQVGREEIETVATRAVRTERFSLPEGHLLSICAEDDLGNFSIGDLYVYLAIYRNFGTFANAIFHNLAHGYVHFMSHLGWPPGRWQDFDQGTSRLRSVTGTNPAAGAEISESVPTNARWRLLAISFQLVAAAGGGTRQPRLTLDDGTNIYYQAVAATGQAGGTTVRYSGCTGFSQAGSVSTELIALPGADLIMGPSHRITTVTASLAGGDDYAAPQMLVEEWFNE